MKAQHYLSTFLMDLEMLKKTCILTCIFNNINRDQEKLGNFSEESPVCGGEIENYLHAAFCVNYL